MKKKKEAAISGGRKKSEKMDPLLESSDTLNKGKKLYASPEDLSPEDLKIYLAGKDAQEELISSSSIEVDKKSLVLDPLWNFTSYDDEPDDELAIGVLVPTAKRYPSLSIKTIGLIPDELYNDDFCNGLKFVIKNYINNYEKNEESN